MSEQLTEPLTVQVIDYGEGKAVTEAVCGIYGAGDDLKTAMADFLLAIVEHRDVLARQERLSEPLKAQLRYLENLLRSSKKN